jgi:pyrimidine-nucleoside phosphorylase
MIIGRAEQNRLASLTVSYYHKRQMHITDIIREKRNGGSLSKQEIDYFIGGYVKDTIPDYQISALMMAIWFQGMDARETTDLTLSMAESGDQIDLSPIPGIKVDKHSTGGVADTTTLVVAPLVAACGGRVAKMSGRGLGHTGGTIDKLESIPGFSVSQSMDRFIEIVSSIGLSVIGQTGDLVPADKKLYALRDVTATVDNLSLIASSIMSKKLAAGSDAIVLDVKCGSGAFMKNVNDAVKLAKIMVEIGTGAGRKTDAVVSDMNQPLGKAIGNSIEVQEAIEVLQGKEQGDLRTVSFTLAAQMLKLAGIVENPAQAMSKLEGVIADGSALRKLADMIEAQSGNPDVVYDTSLLSRAKSVVPVGSEKDGFIASMNAEEIGMAAMLLGAGRAAKEDEIDHAVGIWMKKRLGDPVKKGEPIAEMHINGEKNREEAAQKLSGAVTIGDTQPQPPRLIYQIIS